ncbi:MAG: DNA repair protein RecN [Actinomycetes bacterium]
MIEALRIRGLGVIADANVELNAGLTVITGETGAGKTMVITSLGLLLGGRADAGAVRVGADKAEVEAWFRIGSNSAVAERVEAAGGEVDDGTLLVARTLASDGRSRAFAGGRSVPLGVLAEVGSDLVAVHGQNEQLLLLRSDRRRAALDRYAGAQISAALTDYRSAYDELLRLQSQLALLAGSDSERRLRIETWRAGLAEIEKVAPKPDEDVNLAQEIERLSNSESLRLAAQGAHDALRSDSGSSDAIAIVGQARRLLLSEVGSDAQFADLAKRLEQTVIELGDVADALGATVVDLDADPVRLDAMHQRLAELTGLRRRYGAGGSINDVIVWADAAGRGLLELDDSEERLEQLQTALARATHDCGAAASALSALRTEAAAQFAKAVTAELGALAMPNAELLVSVDQRTSDSGLQLAEGRKVAFGPTGMDEIEFLLIPHRGAPARPIAKGASGGELSRVMLAIEVVFAGADAVSTFVFDEVDAGVGGEAAIEVGRRLAQLSRAAQVLVVTHLAQVAVFADQHLVVAKADDGTVIESGISAVSGTVRIRELARMLGGVSESAAAAEHVEELLELAASAKRISQPKRPRGTSK